ncbi:MAG: ethylbenzene dehydrogenase-related protein, partial [Candidatus Hydrothermarchaeales archaeon]
WLKSEDEDRFAIFWNIDDSIRGFNIGGCAMLCHGDRMRTNAPDEKGDIWHWKASRTNPVGYADDKWMDDTLVEGYEEEDKEAAHRADSKVAGGYRENVNPYKSGPRYYEPNPIDALDAKFILQSEIYNGEAIEITSDIVFREGDTIPGYILEKVSGSRGDMEAKGVWEDGVWSLELKRKLNTGHDDDVQFDVARTYRFGIAVMDNTGGFEAWGKGHSFDLGARTLEFGGLGSEEVTHLALVRDYLITAKSYVKEENKGLAISAVDDALTVYNRVRDTVADKDPDLHISIRNGFVESRRNPSVENLDALMLRIDDATLTLQGKREPKEPTWGLKLLALWGKVQLYAFILLAVLLIYPIYRTLKTSRLPELRYMSLFVFLVIGPIFIEGVGRLGILFQIPLLETLSFTTNEYLTLGWAALMYIAIFVGRLGFNEVDHTIGALRDKSIQLEGDIEKRKKLEEEIKRSYAELDTIYKITAAVNKSLDLNVTLYNALKGEMDSSEADMGIIYLLDREKGDLHLAVQIGMSDEFVSNNSTIKVGEHITGKVTQTGKHIIVDDSKEDDRVTLSVVKTEGYRSLICLPLKYRGEIVGSISVLSRKPHHFKEDNVDFLTSVGEQIAVAIENARLYTKTKELSENLEKKVEVRTIKLQEAYNELKTIDRMKDELVSNISHELRTPLTIAESSIELAMEEKLTSDQKTLLKKGSENLDRLNALIGELIAYAKMSERPSLKLKIEDINEIIRKSIEKFSPLAEREKIAIKTSFEDPLPKIMVDKKKVEHILYNLLGNAIKFNKY